ncbi:MAG: hypothetical protein KAT07_08210 [Calditrichia bacterium]|nr:hypothetical protein [Calditrichia bacterium]
MKAKISRRVFFATGLDLLVPVLSFPHHLFTKDQLKLNQEFINRTKRRIEREILQAMEKIYLHERETFDDNYNSGNKLIEKIVSYYDYQASGISVLSALASNGNARALTLIKKIQQNISYYQQNFFRTQIEERFWEVPLRRLLLHIALAYKKMEPVLSKDEKQWYLKLVEEQVPLAIEHNKNFVPGETDLYLTTNNHTAIFMQGIYYCGQVFNHPEWVDLTLDFAERMYESVHPDGYFEENTNEAHEGGPSLIYTRLTIGSLYDVLDGKKHPREKFIKAGNFYRSFINYQYKMISVADERTNCFNSKGIDYGLAVHSLTDRGRYFIVDNLESMDFSRLSIEALAVIYHELDLMQTGNCALPENRTDGNARITLPLGVVRKHGFTAGISALWALNRVIRPTSHYAMDQQNMLYLSHKKAGLILTGYKSKNDPWFSTFIIGDDAYTVRTGELEMGNGWAEAQLYYETFNAKIRWEISDSARLILSSDSDQVITTSLPVTNEKYIKTDTTFIVKYLNGFSPYSKNNLAGQIKSLIFKWQKRLVIEFTV